jgi:DnaA family protein
MSLKLHQLPLDLDLQAPHALDGFIGSENLLLRALITQQVAGLGESQLFIHGAESTGKTHLAQAACFFASQMGRTAAYVPLKLACTQLNQIGFEPCDLVVLDDVDALVGQAGSEFVLFDLINRLREQHTPLLMTACAPPAGLGFTLPDLVSRLAWGVTLAIHSPDDAEKIELMRRKAQERGFELPFETAVYLLQRYPRDMRSLLAMIQTLDQASLIAQRKISIPFVRSVLLASEAN